MQILTGYMNTYELTAMELVKMHLGKRMGFFFLNHAVISKSPVGQMLSIGLIKVIVLH